MFNYWGLILANKTELLEKLSALLGESANLEELEQLTKAEIQATIDRLETETINEPEPVEVIAPAPVQSPVNSSPSFIVAPGKCLTSKGRMFNSGDAVEAKNFNNGQAQIDLLVETGSLIKT